MLVAEGGSSRPVVRQDPAEHQATEAAASVGQAAAVSLAQAPAPGQTLAEMARHGPRLSDVAGLQRGPSQPAGEPGFAAQVRGTTQRPIDLQMAMMSNDVYSTPDASSKTNTQSEAELAKAGWHRVQPNEDLRTADGRTVRLDPTQLSDPSSGYQAAIYGDGKGHYVVAFAGTDPTSVPDLRTDAGQGLGLQTRQYELAARLGVKMAGIFGADNVAFTGHSLGGGLAAVATVASGAQGVTFNAAGLSNETLREYGSPNSLHDEYATNGALRSYSVAGDPLTFVGHVGTPQPLGTELQMPNVSGSRNPITVHGGSGDHTSYVEGLRNGQATPKPEASLKNRLMEQGGQVALNTLGNALGTGRALLGDAKAIGGDTLRDMAGAVRHPNVFTPSRLAAEVVDGGLQGTGAVVDRALDSVGRQVTVVTDAAGQSTRELLRGTPLEGRLDGVAACIESGGELVRGLLDGAGNFARAITGRVGDLVSRLPDKALAVASTVVNKAEDLVRKAVDGALDVASSAVSKGQSVVSAGVDKAREVASKLNPFKWSF